MLVVSPSIQMSILSKSGLCTFVHSTIEIHSLNSMTTYVNQQQIHRLTAC